jgi:hypothetical protein
MSSLTAVEIEAAWRVAQSARAFRIRAEHDLNVLREHERLALENAKLMATCAADEALQALQEHMLAMED